MAQDLTHEPAKRIPAFTRLASSNLFAHASEQISLVAIPLVAVTLFDAGGGVTSIMQMLTTLPFLLFAIPFGLLIDRGSAKGIMLAGELVRAVSLAGLLAVIITDRASLPLLALLGMADSVGTVAFTVGAPTIVPRLVPNALLSRANSNIELTRSLALAAGPALAGAVIGATGAPAAFWLATVLSLIALLLLVALPRVAPMRAPSGHPLRQVAEGARFVRDHQYLRPIVLTAILFNTAWFSLQGVYVAYAIARLGMSTGQTGATLALYGVGMIVGSRLARVMERRFSTGVSIIVGPLCGATASLLMLATLLWTTMILPACSYLLLGIGPVIWSIATTTLRQAVTPPPMLGRVTALIITSTAGFRPIGAGLGALAYLSGGYELVLFASTIGFLAQAAVILRSPAARLREAPQAPPAQSTDIGSASDNVLSFGK